MHVDVQLYAPHFSRWLINSDYVWESFFRADPSSILSRAYIDVQQLPLSKKELCLHLCRNWILLDGSKKFLRLVLLSGAKIILQRRQHIFIKELIENPTEIKGEILCKDLSPKRNYAAYIIFAGRPSERPLRINQWIYDSSNGHVISIYSMDIRGQECRTREDGWSETSWENLMLELERIELCILSFMMQTLYL